MKNIYSHIQTSSPGMSRDIWHTPDICNSQVASLGSEHLVENRSDRLSPRLRSQIAERLLTLDITEEVVSLHALPRNGIRSRLSAEDQQFSLQTLCPTKGPTVRVSATF